MLIDQSAVLELLAFPPDFERIGREVIPFPEESGSPECYISNGAPIIVNYYDTLVSKTSYTDVYERTFHVSAPCNDTLFRKQIITLQSGVGIDDLFESSDIQVYPNPTKKGVYLKFEDKKRIQSNEIIYIEILSLEGKQLVLKEVQKSLDYLNVSHLDNGIYLLKVYTQQQALLLIKLIKK